MDADQHGAFTDSEVEMTTEVNGKFKVFSGYCKGYNIELAAGQKIVQAWYFREFGWPDNHYSICTFLLEEMDGKTKLEFTQTGIPARNVEALRKGWEECYWIPMAEYLEDQKH
jgi:activator of HSP90 ATPase